MRVLGFEVVIMVNHCVIWVRYEVREYWWHLWVRSFGGGLWVFFFFFFFW